MTYPVQGQVFDHVLIIMFENQYRGYVMENPYMKSLAGHGIELKNSFGVMHPSQTNYIASISGELCNVSDDDAPQPLNQKTIVDLIEDSPKNLSWKAYMESYIKDDTPWQSSEFKPKDHYPYVIKHNPFSSYQSIIDDAQRWNNIDNEAGFYRDLLRGEFPNYAWFTPNMWSDGHYLKGTLNDDLKGDRAPRLVDQQAEWLKGFFESIHFPGPNSLLPKNTLVVVTYDEADFEAHFDLGKKYHYDGPNQIYTVLLGDHLQPRVVHEGYNHYSLLRTIEENFELGSLEKNDKECNYFQFLWNKELVWERNEELSFLCEALSECKLNDKIYQLRVCENGVMNLVELVNKLEPREIDVSVSSNIYLNALQNHLYLAYLKQDGEFCFKEIGSKGDLEVLNTLGIPRIESFSLLKTPGEDGFLMVYRTCEGQLFSSCFSEGFWGDPAELNLKTTGAFELTALGPNVLLVFELNEKGDMACLTMNTADYNVVSVPDGPYGGAYDNTTKGQWSKNAFSLNAFSQADSPITSGEPEPITKGYQCSGKWSVMQFQGGVYLIGKDAMDGEFKVGYFSLSGVMTAAELVSYDIKELTTTNNGYGTMVEAGWSERELLEGLDPNEDEILSLDHVSECIHLYVKNIKSGKIYLKKARYTVP